MASSLGGQALEADLHALCDWFLHSIHRREGLQGAR